MSAEGLTFLSQEEGLRLAPYNDSAGHATIGVGHLIHRGPFTAADVQRYAGFTRADAIRLLKADVAEREAAVERMVTVALNQNEFNALVSFVFNIGTGAFGTSTLLRKLNAGDRRGAADQFLRWIVGGAGLAGRRKRERALFLSGATDPLAVMTPTERRWCQEYDRLKAADQNRPRRGSLRRAMQSQRKRIWRAAQGEGGWETAHRRERYAELMKRTR
jgi:GH24 family phage-related lysozyme (muramidase)